MSMTDYSTASVDDTEMTIEQMLENPANWEFAQMLILSEQVPESELVPIAAKFPAFWGERIALKGH
jgi:hypothetical protein